MSSAKLAAVICVTAVLLLVAGAIVLRVGGRTPIRQSVQVSSEAGSPTPTASEEQLKRAMTFTAPAEPAK